MKSFVLSIFEKDSSTMQLRLLEEDGQTLIVPREVDMSQVDTLVAAVEGGHRHGLKEPKIPGEKIAAFLDGATERWLELLEKCASEGYLLRINAGQQLRHVPWELLNSEGVFRSADHVCPSGPI